MKSDNYSPNYKLRRSHPARGAWIEINVSRSIGILLVSHPARGAWIEISFSGRIMILSRVAPRKGCVD